MRLCRLSDALSSTRKCSESAQVLEQIYEALADHGLKQTFLCLLAQPGAVRICEADTFLRFTPDSRAASCPIFLVSGVLRYRETVPLRYGGGIQ
jgi:hypothetical protein